ncbi:unnamed protein product [Ectocarpus fasciculatus]
MPQAHHQRREQDGLGAGGFTSCSSRYLLSTPWFFFYAQAWESLNILPNLEPDFFALYDPDAAFVRTLEA